MPWAERRDRNRVGTSVTVLGLVELVRALAYEGEVVQRAREVRVDRPEAELLYGDGLTQQPLSFGIVAGSDGLLRRLDEERRIEQIGHGSAARHFKLLASRSKGLRGFETSAGKRRFALVAGSATIQATCRKSARENAKA